MGHATIDQYEDRFGVDAQHDSSPLGTGQDATTAARTRLPFTAIERRIDAVEAANRLRASATDLLGKLSHFPDDADTNDIAVRCVEAIAAVALWRSATHKKENGNG